MAAILLVEPDRYQRLLIAEELSESGHAVFAVATADEALQHLQKQATDLVILEMLLPRMEGTRLLGRLLEMPRNLPVIVHSVVGDRQGGIMPSLVNAWVVKSSDLTPLTHAVQRILRRTPLVSAPWRCLDVTELTVVAL